MKSPISQNGTISNAGDIQPDGTWLDNFTIFDPFIPQVPDPVVASTHAIAAPAPVANDPAGFVIDYTFDNSITQAITGLEFTDPSIYQGYTNAISTAVGFWESQISTAMTVNITFGWGEADSVAVPGSSAGFNLHEIVPVTYSTLYNAIQGLGSLSAAQQTAYGLLPGTDPTGGGVFEISTANAQALGLLSAGEIATDGWVALNPSLAYSFSQAAIGGTDYDAVGALEHEISEVLGRFDFIGTPTTGAGEFFPSNAPYSSGTPQYSLLDMYKYTAQGEAAYNGANHLLPTAASGAAAGVLDEPFVNAYNSQSFSYFSFDGATVTLPYDTPPDIAGGNDPGDWASNVVDSFGFDIEGDKGTISPTDLLEMNVLGYGMTNVQLCYAEGTYILTARGEKRIENLSAGDLVPTHFGGTGRVIWLGRRAMDLTRQPKPWLSWPIRISAGAVAPGLPIRDLWLSPDHAVFIDGVLIPAKLLINGASIQRVKVDQVVYYHVELEQHDVIRAEGLPCESYLDTGDRETFYGGPVTALYPEFSARRWEMAGCAPLVVTGVALHAARSRLAERAGSMDAGGHVAASSALPDDRPVRRRNVMASLTKRHGSV